MPALPKAKPVPAPNFVQPDDLDSLLSEKLASSGLTLADAKHFGMSVVPRTEVAKHIAAWGRSGVPALKLSYLTPDGEPIKERAPGDKALRPFARYRWLVEPLKNKDGSDPAKYLQEAGTKPHIYFPRCGKWPEWNAAFSSSLIITEGELKAAKAVKEGFPSIGLGGVHSWKIGKDGTLFLSELEDIVWSHRKVTLIFDSDVVEKPQVQHALMGLADALTERGALPQILILPDIYGDGRKTGLDDFLLDATGPGELRGMLEDYVLPITAAKELRVLNSRYAYVEEIQRVVTLGSTRIIKPAELPVHDPMVGPEKRLKDGKVSYHESSAAKVWVNWGMRNQVDRIVYSPSLPVLSAADYQGHRVYNRWVGWGCEPKEGDAAPFLDLMRFLFIGSAPGIMDWVLDWLAYPIQNPGAKLSSAVIIFSLAQGNGKSTIGNTMGRIYGDNYSVAGDEDIQNQWNYWNTFRQFVMLDDVSSYTNRKTMREKLKTLITQKFTRVRHKNVPEFEYLDVANYLLTTNQANAVELEDNDRRFFIHEVINGPSELPADFYDKYYDWLDNQDGASIVMNFMLKRNLSKFNPYGVAPSTKAKADMIEAGKNLLAQWVSDLKADPDAILMYGDVAAPHDLYTLSEVAAFYNDCGDDGRKEGRDRKNTSEIAQELHRAGFKQALEGKQLGPKRQRYYVVRDRDHWHSASFDDIKDHLGFTDKPAGVESKVVPMRKVPKFTRKAKAE